MSYIIYSIVTVKVVWKLHFGLCQIGPHYTYSYTMYDHSYCCCMCKCKYLHSLIIPKSHYPSLEATSPLDSINLGRKNVIGAMCSKVPFISSAIVKATGSDSFNLLVNNGEATGQVIFHTHINIIPRKARDCLWASELVVLFQVHVKFILRQPLTLSLLHLTTMVST
ncbi:hypothetical protein UlMin_036196 [Ulmus minor]